MEECTECTKAAIDPYHGVYNRDCVDCGVREVRAAPKVRKVQEQILQAYRGLKGGIVERLKG